MILYQFVTTLYNKTRTGPLYDFVEELFDSAAEEPLYLSPDTIKSWFRNKNPTTTYLKQLKGNFNSAGFNVFIKQRTALDWQEIMANFTKLTQNRDAGEVGFNAQNHEDFIERLELQFRQILRLPMITDYRYDGITVSASVDDGGLEFFDVDITKTLKIEKRNDVSIREKWVVATDLSIEHLLVNRYIDIMYRNLSRGMSLTYFIADDEENIQTRRLLALFGKYKTRVKFVQLSKNPSCSHYLHVPRVGYTFYFLAEDKTATTHGYAFHRFYGNENYSAYRMHEADVDRKVAILRQMALCLNV